MDPEMLISTLRTRDVNAPSGAYIEELGDLGLAAQHYGLVERFLDSDDLDNRDAALSALVLSAGRTGYSIDALLLFTAEKSNELPTVTEMSAVGCLALMAARDDAAAYKALRILSADPQWITDFAGTAMRYISKSFEIQKVPISGRRHQRGASCSRR
jgi:hypothetical protein